MTAADIREQIEDAYLTMHSRADHRPEADDDGDRDGEIDRYVTSWTRDELGVLYRAVGCPDDQDRPALIYLVEAARALCAGRYDTVRALLELATGQVGERVLSVGGAA